MAILHLSSCATIQGIHNACNCGCMSVKAQREPEEIVIRIRRDLGNDPILFVDFGPRVRFTTDCANARKLINALESAIWESVYPKLVHLERKELE